MKNYHQKKPVVFTLFPDFLMPDQFVYLNVLFMLHCTNIRMYQRRLGVWGSSKLTWYRQKLAAIFMIYDFCNIRSSSYILLFLLSLLCIEYESWIRMKVYWHFCFCLLCRLNINWYHHNYILLQYLSTTHVSRKWSSMASDCGQLAIYWTVSRQIFPQPLKWLLLT